MDMFPIVLACYRDLIWITGLLVPSLHMMLETEVPEFGGRGTGVRGVEN